MSNLECFCCDGHLAKTGGDVSLSGDPNVVEPSFPPTHELVWMVEFSGQMKKRHEQSPHTKECSQEVPIYKIEYWVICNHKKIRDPSKGKATCCQMPLGSRVAYNETLDGLTFSLS